MSQVVIFSLGEEHFALEIEYVREIARLQEVTRVPKAPSYVAGVINLRGQIKTVVDLKKRLGLSGGGVKEEDGRIIILDLGGKDFGVIVDSVIGVRSIDGCELIEPDQLLGKETAEYVRGIVKTGDMLVLLLEPGELFKTGAGAEHEIQGDDSAQR